MEQVIRKIFYTLIGAFFLVAPCIAEEPVTFSDEDLNKYKSDPMFEEDRSFKEHQENLRRENDRLMRDIDERDAKRNADKKDQQDQEEREKATTKEDTASEDSDYLDGGSVIMPRPRPVQQPVPRPVIRLRQP